MKKVILVTLLAAAVASMAAAQCPGHEGKGPMMEKKEIRIKMDRDGQCAPGGQCGQGGMCGQGMGRGQWWENPMVAKELGLTDKQSEQIDELTLKHRKSVIKLEADLKIAEIEFRDMMEGDPTEADVRSKAKELGQLREKMQGLKIEHMLAVRKVLTPEQQKKLKGMKPAMRQHRMMMEQGGCCQMPCPPVPPMPPVPPAAPKSDN